MVGIDIIEIDRVSQACASQSFVQRVFCADELDYYRQNGSQAQTLAAMFAAKEAVAKALGCGIGAVDWLDIQVTHDQLGCPGIVLRGAAATVAAGRNAQISISHNQTTAVAVCVLL